MTNKNESPNQPSIDFTSPDFSVIADNLPGIIYQFVVDADGKRRITYISDSVSSYLGYDAEAIKADVNLLLNAVHSEDREMLIDTIKKSRQTLDSYDLKHRFIDDHGQIKWTHVRGKPRKLANGATMWSGMAIDITMQEQTREAYRTLVENSLQGLLIIQDNRVLFANAVATNIAGYSKHELTTMSWEALKDFVHPDDKEYVLDHFQDLRGEQKFQIELAFRILRRAGIVRWVKLQCVKIDYYGRSALQISIVDITEQREAESVANLSQKNFKSTIEVSLDAFYILTAVRDDADEIIDFAIQDVNKKAVQQLGLSRQQLIGGRICELFPINITNGFFDRYKRVVETGQTFEEEFHIPPGHTAAGWYRHQVVKLYDGVAITTRDISSRKIADAAMQEQQNFIQHITDTTPYLLYVFDLHQNKNIYINPQTEKFFGMTLIELQAGGQSILAERLHPDDIEKLSEFNIQWENAADGKIFTREYRLRNAEGVYRWLQSHETVFRRADNGRPTQILGTAVDITESNETRKALQDSEKHHRLTLDALPIVVIIHQEGIIQFINEAGARLLGGKHADEFIGENVLSFVDDEYLPIIRERLAALRLGIVNDPVDVKVKAQDGRLFFVEATSRQQHINGRDVTLLMAIDMSKRRDSEDQLRQSESFLKAIFDNSLSAILVSDDKGNYITANQAAADLLGYPLATLKRMNVDQLQSSDSVSTAGKYQTYLASGRESGEFTFLRPDGEERVALYNATHITENFNLSVLIDITERKHAEKSLIRSEQRFRHLFNGLPLPTYAWQREGDDFVLVDFNNAAAKKADDFGNPGNLIGKKASDYYADRPHILADFKACYEQQITIDREMSYRYSNGKEQFVHATYTYISADLIAVVSEDISKRMATEAALLQSEAKFRAIFNHAPIGIAVSTADGKLTDANPVFQHITGYSLNELTRLNVMDITPSEFYAAELAKWEAVISGKQDGFDIEKEYIRKGGDTVWVEMQSGVVRNSDGIIDLAIGMAQDITDRRHAEASLRQLQQAIEFSPISVIITNRAGVIEYVNASFCRITGYSADEALGQTPRLLNSGEQPKSFYSNMWQTLLSGQEWRGEFRNKKKNGELYWERATIMGVQDQRGEITHFVSIQEDVTRRKQREEEHVRQERLAAVGQLAAGIAHDFNNVMAVISLYGELLTQSPNLTQSEQKKLKIILEQSGHAAELTKQILDFSRRSMRQPRSLDLRILLNEIIKFTTRIIPENILVHYDYNSEPYMVMADPTQIQQIISNLTVNARDAMPRGGKLNFKLSRLTLYEDDTPPISGMAPGNWIKLTVADTGTGIAPDILANVFEPFFTTKEVGQGTGLGLAQVYGIVQQHNGLITVESQLDQGTTFTIYLPANNENGRELTNKKMTDGALGDGETILLVEDNITLLEATRISLIELNYKVLTAENGEVALTYFNDKDSHIDLVLTDVVMPFMDGFELAAALQTRLHPPRVVLMSGFPRDLDVPENLEDIIADWLPKPVDLARLGLTLRKALNKPTNDT